MHSSGSEDIFSAIFSRTGEDVEIRWIHLVFTEGLTGVIRGVLLDVDDTLFDRELAQRMVLEIITDRNRELFDSIHADRLLAEFLESDRISDEEYQAGPPGTNIRLCRAEIFLGALGLRTSHARDIAEIYVNEYPTLDAPVPGARQLIEELAPRFSLGIISNGLADVQYTKLESLGIRSAFECVVLSEDVGVSKPDPRIFHHALSLLSLSPDEALYVGDSFDNDVVGALEVGMQTCWFNPTEQRSSREEIRPTYHVQDLATLASLLR